MIRCRSVHFLQRILTRRSCLSWIFLRTSIHLPNTYQRSCNICSRQQKTPALFHFSSQQKYCRLRSLHLFIYLSCFIRDKFSAYPHIGQTILGQYRQIRHCPGNTQIRTSLFSHPVLQSPPLSHELSPTHKDQAFPPHDSENQFFSSENPEASPSDEET